MGYTRLKSLQEIYWFSILEKGGCLGYFFCRVILLTLNSVNLYGQWAIVCFIASYIDNEICLRLSKHYTMNARSRTLG